MVATDRGHEVEVWLDGQRVLPAEAKVSVFDRGFLYGDSVFETIRTYGKNPFALDLHLARLASSAARVWIELPLDRTGLEREVRRAVAASPHPECYIRLMVTRGTGALGLDPGNAVSPLRVMLVGPLHPPSQAAYDAGIAVVTFKTTRPTDSTDAAGAKVGNYLTAVLASRAASAAGAQEALIVNQDGCIVEGATSNLFWLRGGTLYTPGEDAGILSGITRGLTLEVARERGLVVDYRVPEVDELRQADEVFVTSSVRELLSVHTVDGLPVGKGSVGPVAPALRAALRAHARASALEDARRFAGG